MERYSKFDVLYENFNTGVVIHDADTHVVSANPTALKLLGLTMEQMRGKAITDPHWRFIREDGTDMPQSEYPVGQVLSTHKSLKTFILGVVRSELSRPVWVICNAHPEFDNEGKLKYIVVNFADISEQKHIEEKLNDQLNLTRSMFDSMLDGFAVLDKNGKQLDVNPAFCQMTGFSKDEIVGTTPPFPYWPPEEYESINNAFQKTLNEDGSNFELIFMRKNGERFPVIVAPSTVKDKNNNIIMYLASVKDITLRRHAEQKVKDLAEQLSKTYALAHIGVWSWIIEPDIVIWSEEMYRMSGLDPSKPAPNYAEIAKIHAPESWERLQAAVSNCLKTGEPYQLDMEYILPDGSSRYVTAYGGAKRDASGKITELYGTTQDITEKKQAEIKLKAALKAAEDAVNIKSRFLDIAAHELRTPVSAFSLLVQLAKKKFDKGTPVDLSTLDRLKSQVDRISQLVVELLDVSRLERGVLVLRPSKSNIVGMIQQCIEEFRLREPNRRINLSAPSETIELNIDNLRVFQVISNLVDNAIKYTPEDSPIDIIVEKNPEKVRVSVKDYGEGISEEQQKVLFAPFSRGESEFADKAGGLGLGLFISREIIALHKGTIGVTSKEGSGCCFYFELPRETK
ncbi:sensor histidine kinase [Peredibacter starrii]|uniref:histidine kinase n=1 Tax=Peredibacter starrii TaxID=28202 RepID=A0AAX4HLZ4_9BACT|nr:PAS domain S-box protein [Peredibacter starrii]WPU64357.1 PAS domain S-box protein [Peredibacter starrii]